MRQEAASLSKFQEKPESQLTGSSQGSELLRNTELAKAANLQVSNGIVVDKLLQTSAPNIYAAGDCAEFFNPALNRRLRVEHEDNANSMGQLAGRNMAGASEPYTHLPFFYSDLFELLYEAIGELDARLQTMSTWKEPFSEGIVYYLRDGKIRGRLVVERVGEDRTSPRADQRRTHVHSA